MFYVRPRSVSHWHAAGRSRGREGVCVDSHTVLGAKWVDPTQPIVAWIVLQEAACAEKGGYPAMPDAAGDGAGDIGLTVTELRAELAQRHGYAAGGGALVNAERRRLNVSSWPPCCRR